MSFDELFPDLASFYLIYFNTHTTLFFMLCIIHPGLLLASQPHVLFHLWDINYVSHLSFFFSVMDRDIGSDTRTSYFTLHGVHLVASSGQRPLVSYLRPLFSRKHSFMFWDSLGLHAGCSHSPMYFQICITVTVVMIMSSIPCFVHLCNKHSLSCQYSNE